MFFQGKTALITGASSGLGAALAVALAQEGAKVGLIARREDLLGQVAREVAATGGQAAWAVADVADFAQMQKAVAAISAQLGPVELLVANAGVGGATRLEPFAPERERFVFEVNLFGVIHAIGAVLPGMLQRRQGHLVAVSSLAAYKGLPGNSAYSASKAAVNTYMEGLRIQLRGTGVAVTTICPGFIRTPMTAKHKFNMPQLMEARQAARLMLRAIAQKKGVYNFPVLLSLLLRCTQWLPDAVVAWAMRGKVTE
jgi:short-subunit dehydrogenase